MKKSKSIKDNYKKSTVCLNLFNLVIFFFLKQRADSKLGWFKA